MYKLVLDLENKIKIFICEDDSLLEIRDLPYTVNVLSDIREIVTGYPISESTIVIHSVFSKCLYKDACVVSSIGAENNRFFGSTPINDIKKLMAVFKGCKTRIIDITQYMFSYNMGSCCYVDTINGTCRVFISDAMNVCIDHFICSEGGLAERLDLVKQKYRIENVYRCYDLGNVIDIMYFSNASLLCDTSTDVIHDAALAAYAFDVSDDECADFSIIDQSTENVQNVDKLSADDKVIMETSADIADGVNNVVSKGVDKEEPVVKEGIEHTPQVSHSDSFFSLNTDISDEDDDDEIEVPKKKLPRKPLKKDKAVQKKNIEKKKKVAVDNNTNYIPPKNENKKLSNVTLLLGVVGIVISIAIFAVNAKYKNDLGALNDTKMSVNAQLTEVQNKIATYNSCLNLEGHNLFQSIDTVSQEMAGCNGHLVSLKFEDNTSKAIIQFNSSDDLVNFISQITETHPEVVTGEPTPENTLEISIN